MCVFHVKCLEMCNLSCCAGCPHDRMAQESADAKHQQPYDSTCVAARTRPLVSCRRRRLIQPNTVPNLNGKVSFGGRLVNVDQFRTCSKCLNISEFTLKGAEKFLGCTFEANEADL